ncbi:MAG: ATP-binding protein [Parachlamydiales bacterium]|jgi:signal transduction histidine kinase
MEELFLELAQATQKAFKAGNPEEGVAHLMEAFKLFSKESQKLAASYLELKERFEAVSLELEKKNGTLRKNLHELQGVCTYLTNILKNMAEGLLFINPEGTIVICNAMALQILEKKEAELALKNYFQLFEDDVFGFSMKKALSLGSSFKPFVFDLKNKKIEIRATFISAVARPYQGLIVLLKDISDLSRLEEEAKRGCRLKEIGQMATTIAHEIKNPLGGIRGFATLLHRDLENKKNLQEMASQIIDGTKTLERLVSSVLHFARPVCLKTEETNLSQLIKDLLKLIKVDPTFSEQIVLESHVPLEPILAYADKELLKSALLNLVRNALEAIEKNGLISVALMQRDAYCVIDITDNGVGMDEKELESLFSPFFTTKVKGNGLGLAEAHKIISAHLGQIKVRSAKGQGSTFTVTIPAKNKG